MENPVLEREIEQRKAFDRKLSDSIIEDFRMKWEYWCEEDSRFYERNAHNRLEMLVNVLEGDLCRAFQDRDAFLCAKGGKDDKEIFRTRYGIYPDGFVQGGLR